MFLETFLVVRLLVPVLGLLILVSAIGYPRLAVDQRRIEMENRFHLFVIHMTILSTTNIDRMEVMRKLAQKRSTANSPTRCNGSSTSSTSGT